MSKYKYSTKYLDNPKITIDDLPRLKKELAEAILEVEKGEEDAYAREAQRLTKLIDLLELEHDITIQMYSTGEIIINNRYIISLRNRRWRVKGFAVWYWHKKDIKEFIEETVLKYKLEKNKEVQA